MNYKIYISGYLEETNQLLVSFSSDETEREAKDYPSLAFDLVPYGDISVDEILVHISKNAVSLTKDMVVQETYTDDSERGAALRALVGQTLEYTEEELTGVDTL